MYVLDNWRHSISAISANGEILGQTELSNHPDRIIISPDGQRLIALDKGRGRVTKQQRFIAEKKSSISIVDTESTKIPPITRMEVQK